MLHTTYYMFLYIVYIATQWVPEDGRHSTQNDIDTFLSDWPEIAAEREVEVLGLYPAVER